jgi:hypothetical protein
MNVGFPGGNYQFFFVNAIFNEQGNPYLGMVSKGIYGFLDGFKVARSILRNDESGGVRWGFRLSKSQGDNTNKADGQYS